MKCNNCDNNASLEMKGPNDEGSLYLCVDCNLKLELAQNMEFNRNVSLLNRLQQSLALTTGIPAHQMQQVRRAPLSMTSHRSVNHHVGIGGDNFGVVNTGNMGRVRNSVNALASSGSEEIANALHELAGSIDAAIELQADSKAEALEILSILADEASRPKEARKGPAMKSLLKRLGEVLTASNAVTALYERIAPSVAAFF